MMPDPCTNDAADNRRITVRAPRRDDAVGFALSSVFDPTNGLPEDMLALLSRLDAHEPGREGAP